MNRTLRFVLLTVFLGASLIASGAVGRAGAPEKSDVEKYLVILGDAHSMSMQAEVMSVSQTAPVTEQPPAQAATAAYFPAQYVLDAPAGTSEPISTF